MTFSERIGATSPRVQQIESMSDELRIRLQNCLLTNGPAITEQIGSRVLTTDVGKRVWDGFFKSPLRERSARALHSKIDFLFEREPWHRVYDFIEFLCGAAGKRAAAVFIPCYNAVLAEELSGYRIVLNQVVPVVSEAEIQTIDAQLAHPHDAVRKHLASALSLMADRRSPDYANSIKESLCAVEAVSRLIVGSESATLGEALATIKRDANYHPALATGFSKLFGYASDSGGIRHADNGGPPPDQALAKFMLVSCSAFVGYLTEQHAKAQGKSV